MRIKDIMPLIKSDDDHDFNLAMKLLIDYGYKVENILRRVKIYHAIANERRDFENMLIWGVSYPSKHIILSKEGEIVREAFNAWIGTAKTNMPLYTLSVTNTDNTSGGINVNTKNGFKWSLPNSSI